MNLRGAVRPLRSPGGATSSTPITHRGYRGDGYQTTIYAPPAQQFILTGNGRIYHPVSVRADTWQYREVYHGNEWVERMEA